MLVEFVFRDSHAFEASIELGACQHCGFFGACRTAPHARVRQGVAHIGMARQDENSRSCVAMYGTLRTQRIK
jgi:hypothetical protein